MIRQGEPYPDAWLVRSGALSMELVDHDGHRLVLDLLGRGISSAGRRWDGRRVGPRDGAERVDGSVRSRSTRGSRVERVASPGWRPRWRDRLADRLVARLDDLAERFGQPVPGGTRVALPLTQEHLAALTGATRESVNRALAELVDAGRIERRAGRYVSGAARCGCESGLALGLEQRQEHELQ